MSLTKQITSIIAGSESSYFLFSDGWVGSCGRNNEGQLGDGTFIDRDKTAVIIPHGDKIVGLGSGPSSQSVFFIGESYTVYAAGANNRYQLGLDPPDSVAEPTAVAFTNLTNQDVDIVKICSSGTHTILRVQI
jgi:alpha-tubulin suppressor-like RCC1 family protein